MPSSSWRLTLAAVLAVLLPHPHGDPVVRAEFIFIDAPFASAHASTIVETPHGLVAAWFGGSAEGATDVTIWSSRLVNGKWTAPRSIATGSQPGGTSRPCWNPVLFQPYPGTLWLFYKVGPSPARWWGLQQTSHDDGITWGTPTRLPDGILGPIKDKPVSLAPGIIMSPSSTESPDTPPTWRIHFERSADSGRSWTVITPPEPAGTSPIEAIQPSILVHPGDTLEAIGRTRSGKLFMTWSPDRGAHWSPLELGDLPNPNAGIDAVTLRDGRYLLVYNPTTTGRSPLSVAVSHDGRRWQPVVALETAPGEYSYPAVIQSHDGLIHVTYTWRRQRIKHVVLDPGRF